VSGLCFHLRVAAAAVAVAWLSGAALPRPRAAGPASLRLYVLDGGTLKERDGAPYGLTREQLAPRDLSDLCALVVHPQGALLWDTGLNESVNRLPADAPSAPGRPRPGDRVARTLTSQLAEIGYRPSDITYLALSHSHWDHTGNVADFLGATWLAQKAERDLMFGERPLANQADFDGLRTSRTRIVEGDYDVFGDGTVRLIATPGHTPGHQALLVKLPKTGAVILSGDLYHFPEELTLHPTPRGPNAAQIAASMAKVQQLLQQTKGQLWIQHDILGWASLKKAPAYYE
jgi:N-acyl homoserine lactone hydrolase